jgi:hypothetical protein
MQEGSQGQAKRSPWNRPPKKGPRPEGTPDTTSWLIRPSRAPSERIAFSSTPFQGLRFACPRLPSRIPAGMPGVGSGVFLRRFLPARPTRRASVSLLVLSSLAAEISNQLRRLPQVIKRREDKRSPDSITLQITRQPLHYPSPCNTQSEELLYRLVDPVLRPARSKQEPALAVIGDRP